MNNIPEGMVRTFTDKEPSSFETLGSQFSLSWKPIRTFVFVPGQTQSPSSLGLKVRIQTHGSPKNASWDGQYSVKYYQSRIKQEFR